MISYRAVVAHTLRLPPPPCADLEPTRDLACGAVYLLEDFGRALERDLAAARAAADRLAQFLAIARPAHAASQTLERQLASARASAEGLVQFLATARPEGAAPVRGGLAPWQRRRIEHYLEAHLEETINVEMLAEALPLSISHFCRAFKETFGETPHAHIMRLRFERAKHLMLSTQEPLSQIALACGLADQAHLSKLFRRRLGESPSTWRRRHLRGPSAAEAQVWASWER
jgi:AraC-like DNA-binding protein